MSRRPSTTPKKPESPPFRKSVGQRIRSVRKGATGYSVGGRSARTGNGVTLAALAESTGISADHLGRIENGKHAVSVDALFAIATALRVAPGDLLPRSAVNVTVREKRIEDLRTLLMAETADDVAWVTEVVKTMLSRRPRG